jgi:hypothetical protein
VNINEQKTCCRGHQAKASIRAGRLRRWHSNSRPSVPRGLRKADAAINLWAKDIAGAPHSGSGSGMILLVGISFDVFMPMDTQEIVAALANYLL